MLIREDLMQGRLDTPRRGCGLRRDSNRFIRAAAKARREDQTRGEKDTPNTLPTITHAIPNPANLMKDDSF
jgi:hypothetical protein